MALEEFGEEPVVEQEGVGQRLRRAREERGLAVADVAKQTRVPERHLVSIENGDFNALPAPTYAVGFSRSYARFLNLDERLIVDQVRAEVAAARPARPERPEKFEPGDPARVPSRRLVWFGLFAMVLLLTGMFAFYRSYFAPGLTPAPLTEERRVAANEAGGGAVRLPPPQATPAPAAGGQVVFTALEDGVWARFYDGAGQRLQEKQMARGETFAVPQDVQGAQIWTGRPDAFAITVGGRPVPKLSEELRIMRDVPISAEALLARQGAAAGGTTASAANNAGTTN